MLRNEMITFLLPPPPKFRLSVFSVPSEPWRPGADAPCPLATPLPPGVVYAKLHSVVLWAGVYSGLLHRVKNAEVSFKTVALHCIAHSLELLKVFHGQAAILSAQFMAELSALQLYPLS